MSYDLSWYIPNKVLSLKLFGDYSTDDAGKANKLILSELEKSKTQISILIDMTEMENPRNFTTIREKQMFMRHKQLRSIYAVSNKKIIKLAIMVIFNVSQVQLYTVDSIENASQMIKIFEQ